MNMPRWLAARHLKRQRGDALQSWVSIKDAALQVFFMSGWHWSVCKVWAARTASSHGWKGVAWCSTQLAFHSQSADQVAPAQQGYQLASEASSESSEPSVLGRSDDDSSGVSTCFLMPLVRDLCTSQRFEVRRGQNLQMMRRGAKDVVLGRDFSRFLTDAQQHTF